MSIVSVTVTYNGSRTIAHHLEALLAQTRPLDEIVVVDNGSSDGSAAFLAERYPQVTVVRLEENIGMAGAWAAGLDYVARNRSHEWIWSFDDDSVPSSDLLESLLRTTVDLKSDNTVGVLAPIPIESNTGVRHVPRVRPKGYPYKLGVRPAEAIMRQPVWFADYVITSGCLIRRAVVERIGLPRAEYYMDFFDIEYCLRARAAGYRIGIVTACEMPHVIGKTRKVRLLGRERGYIYQPPWREYYIARNITYAAWCIPELKIRKGVAAAEVIYRAFLTLFCSEQRITSLTRIMQGVLDGARGRLGIRFRPSAYSR